MKSLFCFLLALLLNVTFLKAQQAENNHFEKVQLSSLYSTHVGQGIYNCTKHTQSPFISLAFKYNSGAETALKYRYKQDNRWSEWMTVKEDSHHNHNSKAISQLYFLPANTNSIQINANEYIIQADDEMHVFYPKHSQSNTTVVRGEQNVAGCPCPQPSFKGRDQWCQIDDCPIDNTPVITEVSHLIVHHSATSNTSNDWPAVVHSFWSYHVNTNGWDDIGYNWLIDPNGVIYEGRADNFQGAHFCGMNPNTMGICVIGNFEDEEPSEKAMKSLKRLFAWKSCKEDIDPSGISYHPPSDEEIYVVSGHRDGCQTACPGEFLYDLLPELRTNISLEIDSVCGSILPPVALTASELSSGVVELNWTDQSDNETVFVIERKTAASPYFYPLNISSPNSSSYVDNSMLLEEALEYRVLAANEQDTSVYSNIATLITTSSKDIAFDSALLSVSPSLFNNTLNLENKSDNQLQLSIYGLNGSLIYEDELKAFEKKNISTSTWQKGLYIVQSRDIEKSHTLKIVKQ